MTNAGLRITFSATWSDDDLQAESEYIVAYDDPSLETITFGLVRLIEASYGWGASREQILYKIREALVDVEGM